MFARSRGSRAALTILGALVPFASYLSSGCGSSGSGSATPGAEGGSGYTTVVTAGGGLAEDGASIDPFESSSSSGSSSGASSDSGSGLADSGSSSSGGGGDASDGSTGSSSSGGSDASGLDSGGVAYVPPVCGGQAGAVGCDLRTSTCCLTQTLVGTCVAKGTACPQGQASVGCLQALECPSGQSCCGVIEDIQGAVIASCQNVVQGGNCPYAPYTSFSLYQGVQLCKTDAECKNVTDAGAPQLCIHQTCFMGAMLSMCGVQSTAPLSCSASP